MRGKNIPNYICVENDTYGIDHFVKPSNGDCKIKF